MIVWVKIIVVKSMLRIKRMWKVGFRFFWVVVRVRFVVILVYDLVCRKWGKFI